MVNCNCVNIEVGSFDNQVEITHPNLSHPIMVDKCIAEEIKELLDHGVKTMASCCGYNKTIPSIMVAPESVKLMERLGYIHCFNSCCPIGYGSDLLFFPKSVSHKGYELLEWKCIPQPLFTLTPEEVTIVEHFLSCDKDVLGMSLPTWERDLMIRDLEHILDKIKDYQNGKEV